jgi:hypothetical protein
LFFLGVACDGYPPKGKTTGHYNYAPDNFSNLLQAHSKDLFQEIRVSNLKGTAVSQEAVLGKLRSLQKAMRPEDLLFVYWGTHGGTDENGWSAYLAEEKTVRGRAIKRELAQFPCPVIAVISTCGSGGFARATPKDLPLPKNVTAFCACRRGQGTDNQLDMALLEALAGFADFDGNGDVTLREALKYVPRRYRDWYTEETPDAEKQMPVLSRNHVEDFDRPLSRIDRSAAVVAYEGRWYGATILERNPGAAKVRFLGWDPTGPGGTYSFPDCVVPEETFEVRGGRPVAEVEWKGTWYPARILGKSAAGTEIHYIGYPDTDNETVPPERIRMPFVGRPRNPDQGRKTKP